MRVRLHNLLRNHYYFTQGSTAFYLCVPRLRWQRPTEYAVSMAGLSPVVVTVEQFVNLDQRLRAEAATSLDEAARLFGAELSDQDDLEEDDDDEYR